MVFPGDPRVADLARSLSTRRWAGSPLRTATSRWYFSRAVTWSSASTDAAPSPRMRRWKIVRPASRLSPWPATARDGWTVCSPQLRRPAGRRPRCRRSVLGWLLRICRRPGWTPLGNCLQPVLAVRRAGQPGLALRALRMEKRPLGGRFLWRRSAFVRLAGRCARRRWRGSSGLGYRCPASALSSGSLSKSRKPLWSIGVADPADFMLEVVAHQALGRIEGRS